MKNLIYISIRKIVMIGCILAITSGCEREFSDDVDFATFSANPDVFIDGFSGGLQYLPFAGSKLNAFTVDTETSFQGSAAMRFDVPNVGDPEGAFAGAIFPDASPRDLSQYDALTFYAKASKAATINEIGFGNDFGENKFLATRINLRLDTNWKKYIIPIPDASKLTAERGMFWYSEGPEDGDGYTFWIDELQFETLGTVAQAQPAIFNGEDVVQQTFIGSGGSVSGLTQTFNVSSGQNVTVNTAPSYYSFTSSNIDVVRVNELGVISILDSGTAEISAILAGVRASGSLTLESLGEFVAAPAPTRPAANVISIFSDAYNDVPVDFYNGFFAPFQTTQGGADLNINGDQIIRYTELNFVASEFKNPTINATEMTHLHVDIQIQEGIDPGDFIRIELGDFGPDGAFGGDNDASGSVIFNDTALSSNQWISLDIPLSDFTGLTSRANLAQIFFVSDATISTLLVDNIYLYKE